ncbi:NGG1p interacting factor 3 [Heliocybe sulcata]|uniref:NGG1p interacting factor 3 n=1 Tax=Heliocybe sulcata TaxID=5364 RepID=A0A5C3NSX6_9AGAM|nr:NGG1p interacting factor 3 [Heliocybe sulcata]
MSAAGSTLVKTVCRVMQRIAPLHLAESWDNVGLLLEAPYQRAGNRVLLTIDVTPPVVEEALSSQTACIIAYHPTLFHSTKKFTLDKPVHASLLRLAAAGISVYSPHTALDSVTQGINDWLCMGLLGLLTSEHYEIKPIGPLKDGGALGRILTLGDGIEFTALLDRVKKHLGLSQIQVAYPYSPASSTVRSVAICAGGGGSVLDGADTDVYYTGEMAHHEVLAAVGQGKYVILCGHTNTERGFLPILKGRLEESELVKELNMEIDISKADKHPLEFF